MVLASLTAISQSCAGDYSVPAQAPLARKMLRHLLPTQLRVWERDKGTGRSRELWGHRSQSWQVREDLQEDEVCELSLKQWSGVSQSWERLCGAWGSGGGKRQRCWGRG